MLSRCRPGQRAQCCKNKQRITQHACSKLSKFFRKLSCMQSRECLLKSLWVCLHARRPGIAAWDSSAACMQGFQERLAEKSRQGPTLKTVRSRDCWSFGRKLCRNLKGPVGVALTATPALAISYLASSMCIHMTKLFSLSLYSTFGRSSTMLGARSAWCWPPLSTSPAQRPLKD